MDLPPRRMCISYELNFRESYPTVKNYTLCGSLQSNEVYSVAEFPQYLQARSQDFMKGGYVDV